MRTSSSSLCRLPLLAVVVTLAFPSRSSAAPLDFESLLGKARGFLTLLWAPVGCEINPDGRCVTSPESGGSDSGSEVNPDGRYAFARPRKPVPSDVGCEPDEHCRM